MQQTSSKGVQDKAQLDGKGDSLGTEQESKIWPYQQMVYAQTKICYKKWDIKFSETLKYKRIT